MATIEEISIKNYRVLQNVTLKGLQFGSVFLGPNGRGMVGKRAVKSRFILSSLAPAYPPYK